MKKAGIITFHCADNFGAVLQAYALSKTIGRLGIDVEVIDFKPKSITKQYTLFPNFKDSVIDLGILRTLKVFIIRIINYRRNKIKKNNFQKFRDCYLKVSKRTYFKPSEIYENKPRYDYYITGSDQVWNPDIFSSIGGSYFLDFAPEDATKIAYAASVAREIDDNQLEIYGNDINDLDWISVREESAVHIIEKYSDKEISVTLDPVFLISKEEWEEIAVKNTKQFKYIFVYDLTEDRNTILLANRIAKKNNYKIISYSKQNEFVNWDSSFFSSSPNEFLGLIKNAEFVITSSFHGVVFSLVFNKEFYTIPHSKTGSRMVDLLAEFSLENRVIQDINNIDVEFDKIDYVKVNNKMSELKDYSIKFLKKALIKEKD